MKSSSTKFAAYFLLFAGVINLAIFAFKSSSGTGHYEEQISEAAGVLKANLVNFFSKTEKTVSGFNREIQERNLDQFTKNDIDLLANRYLSDDLFIKGLILFTGQMNYVFLKDKNSRITTFARTNDSLLNWQRLDKNLKPVSEWTDTYNFFLNEENKALLQGVSKEGKKLKWIKLKSEIPDRRDLILLVNYVKTADNKNLYITYVFQTKDFAGFFLDKLKAKHPVISFFTNDKKVLTPIVTEDTVYVNKIKKEEAQIAKIFKTWENMDGQPHSFSFESNNRFYWTRVESITNKLGISAFALTFSQESLEQLFTGLQNIFLYLGTGSIGLGIILLILTFLKSKKAGLSKTKKPEPLSEKEIKELIAKGESGRVEYKSSLRYDYRQEKENKVLENVILKSIAAFANAAGGTLFIGVDDNGNVLGLQNDFDTLKKNDVDYFELHLRKLINNQFGIHFTSRYLTIRFPAVDGKIICTVQVAPSAKPVYVKLKDKQGQKTEKFYVRMGNASQEITSLTEMEAYIRHHFMNQ